MDVDVLSGSAATSSETSDTSHITSISATNSATENSADDKENLLDEEFLFYSHIYSAITVIFAMALLSKFLANEFRFGFRSFLALVVLFVGEPVCQLVLLKGSTGLILFSVVCFTVYKILPPSLLPAQGKSVLITGCDTGIGSALVKYFDSIGMQVFAGCLNTNGQNALELKQLCSDRLVLVQMDVTDESQMLSCHEIVRDKVGDAGLWGLINNAGVCYLADLELTSDQILRRILDVNLHGAVRCTRTFLPLLRRASGRVVNVSSLTGVMALKCWGGYAMSKAALEMFSEVLRLEMKRFNISVSTLRLGGFKTGSMDAGTLLSRHDDILFSLPAGTRVYYGDEYLTSLYHNFSTLVPSFPEDISPVCEAAREALLSRSPSHGYNVGRGVSVVLGLYSLLPIRLRDRLSVACSVKSNVEPVGLVNTKL